MKVQELLTEPAVLTEAQTQLVIDKILPFCLISEEDGGGDGAPPSVPDGNTEPAPTTPPPERPPSGGWYPGFGGVWRPGGAGFNGNKWFGELYRSLKTLAVASNISKRLKELGISGEGAKRVKLAQKVAAKHVKLLLTNPGATAYRIPVWTTTKPPKTVIKRWNEAFSHAFIDALGRPLMESDDVATRAIKIAAHMLGTDPDDLDRVGPDESEEVLERGKQTKRTAVKAADATWYVVQFVHRNKQYARIEDPEKKNKMYQKSVKTGPAEITEK